MSKKTDRAYSKFQRLAKLNAMQDAGGDEGMAARRVKRALADSWVKRTSNNHRGFYSAKSAKPGACLKVKV